MSVPAAERRTIRSRLLDAVTVMGMAHETLTREASPAVERMYRLSLYRLDRRASAGDRRG